MLSRPGKVDVRPYVTGVGLFRAVVPVLGLVPGLTCGHGFPRITGAKLKRPAESPCLCSYFPDRCPGRELSGVLAAGESRCWLREWLTSRIRPPSVRTFSRIFGHIDAATQN